MSSLNKTYKIVVLLVLICFTHVSTFSQTNALCGNATPICTGIPVNYPAVQNAPNAPAGPSYGCLGSEPNPSFFFLQMSSSGPVSISMSAAHDIDFICWGPYTSLSGVCSNLGSSFIQSCSYSPSNVETCTIGNAVAGAFYVMMITNFSNTQQQINFNQSNASNPNAGTTNCGVVCGITLNSSGGVICAGQSNVLTAITSGTAVNSYTLSGPGGVVNSGAVNPGSNTITNTASGITATSIFTLMATTATGTCQTTAVVPVVDYPTYSLSPASPTICQGGQTNLCVTFLNTSANPASFNYFWSADPPSTGFITPSPGVGIFSPGLRCTNILPSNIVGPQANIIYSVVVSPTAASCPVSHTVMLTINNPLTPTLSIPAVLCNTTTPFLLTATPGGGLWSGNPAVAPNGLFTASAIAPTAMGTNTVLYTVAVGTCNVSNAGTVTVSQYNTPALTSSISTLCATLDPQFDLMTIVQSTVNGHWLNSPYVFNNHFNPSTLPTGNYNLTYTTGSSPDPAVCPGSTVLVVPVFNPPTPVIAVINPVCNNQGTVQLAATPTVGGLWTGNSAVAALTGVFTPTTVTTAGAYPVVYTSGHGTCVASNTATIKVAEFHPATLTGTVPNLCSTNSNPFNLMSIVQDNHGTWTGLNILNNIFHSGGLPTGTYSLAYTNNATYPGSPPVTCSVSSSILVSVLNPPTAFITQVGPLCSTHGPLQLTVTPNTGVWISSPYLTQGGVFTPSLSPIGNGIVQYVIGTSTCNTQQSSTISVEGFIPATITSAIPNQCNTNPPLNLLPFTLTNQGSWSGPGILGASFNPAVSGTGNITLSYHTASSPSGLCPDQATISVSVFSLSTPVFNTVGPLCTSAPPVKLNVSPLGGIFGSANNSAVDASGLFIPASAKIGDNIINYSITSGPCVAYAQTTISIEKFVSADFTGPAGPFCKNDPRLQRNLNDIVVNAGGTWSGPGITPAGLFTFASANVGSNTIYHGTHSSPTTTLCPDSKSIVIDIYDAQKVVALSDKYQGCVPAKVFLNTPSVGNGVGLGMWDFGDGSEPEPGLNISHTYNAPGSYSVVFTYSLMVGSDFACVSHTTIPMPIKISETPKPDFTYEPGEVMISDPKVQFNNISALVDHNKYQWVISGTGLNETLNEVDPIVTFPNVGDYHITLSAITLNGCKSEVSKIITVKTEFNVFIPSSFTPNGDGINEYFYPVFSEYGLDKSTYELEIFDRWGNIMFQTKDTNQGWDGKKAGQLLKQDVYVYKLKYKDVDGNVYSKTGYITLLK